MPYVDTVGDIVRVTAAAKYNNSQYQEMIFHYKCISAGGSDSRGLLANAIDNTIVANLVPIMSHLSIYHGTKVSMIKSAAKWMPVTSYVDTAGSLSGPPLPTQVRPLISWRTQYSGPAYRGRTYVFTPEDGTVDTTGRPSTTLIAALTTWSTAMLSVVAVGGSNWQPGIYHRKPTADIGSSFDAYAAKVVDAEWATQRRSGDFGRPNAVPF